MKKPFFLILAIQLLLINSQLTQAQSVSLTQGSYTGATFSVTTPDLITGTRTVDGEKYIVLSFEGGHSPLPRRRTRPSHYQSDD